MISDKLKKIVFDELYRELGKAEVINYNGNVWFIDREKKYWYFELQKDGRLWWRYSFFNNFFLLFSFNSFQFEPILKDWVEEVLNHKVNTTRDKCYEAMNEVEEVLNCKVNTTYYVQRKMQKSVEEVLNCKVNTTYPNTFSNFWVEEVLNHKVNTTLMDCFVHSSRVEEVLNHKVDTTRRMDWSQTKMVEEVLKCKVNTTVPTNSGEVSIVEEVLNHTVTNMDGGEMIDEESYVDKVLNHTIK